MGQFGHIRQSTFAHKPHPAGVWLVRLALPQFWVGVASPMVQNRRRKWWSKSRR